MQWRAIDCSSVAPRRSTCIMFPPPRTITIDPATGAVTYGNVYTQLLEYIVSADLVFYVLLVVAVIVLRKKRPAAERPYRTWGYPIVPLLSVALAGSPLVLVLSLL